MGSNYPDDTTPRVDGGCQRGRIDTARNAGHHDHAMRHQLTRELSGPSAGLGRRITRAHDCDRALLTQREIAGAPESRS